jgi:MYXO-CTERM domain-containing protein
MMLPLLVPLASAYNLSGEAWPDTQLPLEVHWTGSLQGFTEAELAAVVEDAASAWVTAAPCTFGIEVVHDPAADEWFEAGGVAVLFGDLEDILGDGVWLAVVRTMSSGRFERNGQSFRTAGAAEIIFDGDLWATDADIETGDCSGRRSAQAVLTHELGHVLGLDDSCDASEACTDEDARAATMYWAKEVCDTDASTLGADDIEGLAALYGQPFSFAFSCSAAADDGLTVSCLATDPSDVATLSPTWDFGDGGAAEGSEASHTYASPGSYDIRLCILPPDCGEPRCATQSFTAVPDPDETVGDDTDTDDTDDTDDTAAGDQELDSDGCGCATDGGNASLILGALFGLAAAAGRRR